MIVVLKRHITESDKAHLCSFLQSRGFTIREIVGTEETVFGAVGRAAVDIREVELLTGVERVVPISKPYKLASRELQPQDTVVEVGPVRIGGSRITVIAGPCAVESREAILEAASIARDAGAVMLRGGAFKPRTSPYAFQGLGEEGLRYLRDAGDAHGMPVVSEIVSPNHVPMFREYVQMMQIGARNMQNFELLKAVGDSRIPVILKRGLAATIEEWLMAAEYLLAHGARDVVLCERGIRTFERYTRNTLDISSIPVVGELSHLPVIVDPSHATGRRDKVPPVALAAIAAGAHGLIVEMHPRPEEALSDGPQSLYPSQLEKLMRDVEVAAPLVGKELSRLPRRSMAAKAGSTAATEGDKTRVAYQGAPGAYSERTIRRLLPNADPVSSEEFADVFAAVLAGEVDYGLLPIENSLTGSIHENFDLLLQYPDIEIIAETMTRIEHSLIAPEGVTLADVRTVYSHPQGLAQCRAFLKTLQGVTQVPFYDTAGAVAHVAKSGSGNEAAIAHASTADVYGLTVLREGIETNPRNYTRFVLVRRIDTADAQPPGSPAAARPVADGESGNDGGGAAGETQKAMVVFAVPDSPGALSVCLESFSRNTVNMTKLESRPIPGQPWRYMFYVEVTIPEAASAFDTALREVSETATNLRVLGRYRPQRFA